MKDKPEYIYEGFFDSFQSASPVDLGFTGDRWLHALNKHLENLRNAAWNDQLPLDQTLLSVLAITLDKSTGSFRVLDIGGGLGATFFWLEQTLGESFGRLDYTVVDLPEVIEYAKTLDVASKHSNLVFSKEIPEGKFDLVNFGSSLHYFEAPGTVIEQAAGTGAQFLVFSRTPVNPTGTYVTLQNYYESRIPVTVIGLPDLNAWCAENGYTLIATSASSSAVLGGTEPFPMRGIPEKYKIKYPSDLIYHKR